MNTPPAHPETIFPYPAKHEERGVPCYHPDVAHAQEDYPEEVFARLVELEDGHFWFEARNEALQLILSRNLPDKGRVSFLEVGCGTGFVLRMIRSIPGLLCAGAEVHVEGAVQSKSRLPDSEIVQLDVLRMEFAGAFDAVGAFDVIEHLDDDVRALSRLRESLRAGGMCFISVPQHQWLWSAQDEVAGHKRRYTRRMLNASFHSAGFEAVEMTSFCSVLLPFFAVSRLIKRKKVEDVSNWLLDEFVLPAGLNTLFRALLKIDILLIRLGFSLPFGGSLLAVARRTD